MVRSPANSHPAQYLGPGADIGALLHLWRRAAQVTPAQGDLVTDDDIVANARAAMNNDAQRVGQEHGLGERQADVAAEIIHEEPAHDRQPTPRHENQQPGSDGVAKPRVLGVATLHRSTL